MHRFGIIVPTPLSRDMAEKLLPSYTAAITAAAILLLGIIVLPAPPRQCVVEAAVVSTDASWNDDDLPLVQSWLTSSEVLQAAAANVGSGTWADSPDRIRVTRISSPDEAARLAIEYVDQRRGRALGMAKELATLVVEDYFAAARQANVKLAEQRRAQLRELVRRTAQQERELREKVDNLRQSQFSAALLAAQRPSAHGRHSGAANRSWQPMNPDWLACKRLLDQLVAVRDQLLATLQPEHPQVVALNLQISQKQAALSQIPRRADDASGGEEESSTLPISGPSAQAIPARDLPVSRRQIAQQQYLETESSTDARHLNPAINLAAQLDGLRQQLVIVGRQRINAEQELEAADFSRPSENAWKVEPARIVGQTGGAPSAMAMMLAAALALIGGVISHRLQLHAIAPRILDSVQDLRLHLDLPVLGQVATRKARAATPPRNENTAASSARILRRTAEVVIGAYAIVWLSAIWFDSALLADFFSNPCFALREAAARATGA